MKLFTHILIYILLCWRSITTAEDNYEDNNNMENNLNKQFKDPHGPPLGIIDGTDDKRNRYPFVVSIGIPLNKMKYFRTCSGSLLSDQWVLTAAHCYRDESHPSLVRYGDMDVLTNDTRATYTKIIKFIRHPNYLSTAHYSQNDFALILIEKINYNHYGRILSVDFGSLTGLPADYVGFASARPGERPVNAHGMRQYGEALIIKCTKAIPDYPVMCLASPCSKRTQKAYFGDSGGPLLVYGLIVGVCQGAAREYKNYDHKTVIYCAVSPFQDWIQRTTSINRW